MSEQSKIIPLIVLQNNNMQTLAPVEIWFADCFLDTNKVTGISQQSEIKSKIALAYDTKIASKRASKTQNTHEIIKNTSAVLTPLDRVSDVVCEVTFVVDSAKDVFCSKFSKGVSLSGIGSTFAPQCGQN